MRQLVTALAVCLALPFLPAAAQEPPATLTGPRAALWREIRALNDSMEAAFNRDDMQAVAAFYADDARLAGEDGDIVEGRAAVDAYWGRLGGRGGGNWRLEVFEVGGHRDLAYQRGRSHLTFRGRDGRERTSVVDFVVVWRRTPDGRLRIWLDLY